MRQDKSPLLHFRASLLQTGNQDPAGCRVLISSLKQGCPEMPERTFVLSHFKDLVIMILITLDNRTSLINPPIPVRSEASPPLVGFN